MNLPLKLISGKLPVRLTRLTDRKLKFSQIFTAFTEIYLICILLFLLWTFYKLLYSKSIHSFILTPEMYILLKLTACRL